MKSIWKHLQTDRSLVSKIRNKTAVESGRCLGCFKRRTWIPNRQSRTIRLEIQFTHVIRRNLDEDPTGCELNRSRNDVERVALHREIFAGWMHKERDAEQCILMKRVPILSCKKITIWRIHIKTLSCQKQKCEKQSYDIVCDKMKDALRTKNWNVSKERQ